MEITQETIRAWLRAEGSARLSEFSAKLIPGLGRPVLGVTVPRLRAFAKELARTDYRAALAALAAPESHEEMLLRGLVVGYARLAPAERLKAVADFVPMIDNWAVCDIFVPTLTDVRRYRGQAWAFLQPYLASAEEFPLRFAVVMLRCHFLTEDYALRVVDCLRRVRSSFYYVEMAVGWALADCFVKFEELTWPALTDGALSAEIRRKACRKILESRRTPQAARSRIRDLMKTI